MQEKPKNEKTKIEKVMHYECGVLARDTKNEPKMQENLNLENLNYH
jgi:hypothetical protein